MANYPERWTTHSTPHCSWAQAERMFFGGQWLELLPWAHTRLPITQELQLTECGSMDEDQSSLLRPTPLLIARGI